jgi:hypothetical protein
MKILEVDIGELEHCAKSHFKICCILGYIKMANLTYFQILKLCTVHCSHIHAFFVFAKPKTLRILDWFFAH